MWHWCSPLHRSHTFQRTRQPFFVLILEILLTGSEIRCSPVDMVHIPLCAGFHTCLGWMCVSDMFLFVTIPVITVGFMFDHFVGLSRLPWHVLALTMHRIKAYRPGVRHNLRFRTEAPCSLAALNEQNPGNGWTIVHLFWRKQIEQIAMIFSSWNCSGKETTKPRKRCYGVVSYSGLSFF